MLKVTDGVPQGSTLGPLLFTIYINDLSYQPLHGSLYVFADDTALVYNSISGNGIVCKIESDIKILRNWFAFHKIFPNINKTKIPTFSYRDSKSIGKFFWDGLQIEEVKHIRYLGVIIDEKLAWGHHIEQLRKKLHKLNYLLYYLSKFFLASHLRKIYIATVESTLCFGIIHWGGAASYFTNELIVAQKMSIRTIVRIKRFESTSGWFSKLNLLKLPDLYKALSG